MSQAELFKQEQTRLSKLPKETIFLGAIKDVVEDTLYFQFPDKSIIKVCIRDSGKILIMPANIPAADPKFLFYDTDLSLYYSYHLDNYRWT